MWNHVIYDVEDFDWTCGSSLERFVKFRLVNQFMPLVKTILHLRFVLISVGNLIVIGKCYPAVCLVRLGSPILWILCLWKQRST